MKQRGINKRSQNENPIWCDHCRVRIAPYEEIAIAGAKAFHAHCFNKEGKRQSKHDPFEEAGLNFVTA
jgi:hypothetical protein